MATEGILSAPGNQVQVAKARPRKAGLLRYLGSATSSADMCFTVCPVATNVRLTSGFPYVHTIRICESPSFQNR